MERDKKKEPSTTICTYVDSISSIRTPIGINRTVPYCAVPCGSILCLGICALHKRGKGVNYDVLRPKC